MGAYLVFHMMLADASVRGGPERFDAVVEADAVLAPSVLVRIEVYLPLLLHSLDDGWVLASAQVADREPEVAQAADECVAAGRRHVGRWPLPCEAPGERGDVPPRTTDEARLA